MANNNNVKENTQNVNNNGVPENPAPQQNVPVVNPEPVVATNPPPTTTEPKQNWFKAHWKGLVAGAAAVAGAVGSGFVAYNKGKAAGAAMAQYPNTDNEDYSLNPNVE